MKHPGSEIHLHCGDIMKRVSRGTSLAGDSFNFLDSDSTVDIYEWDVDYSGMDLTYLYKPHSYQSTGRPMRKYSFISLFGPWNMLFAAIQYQSPDLNQ